MTLTPEPLPSVTVTMRPESGTVVVQPIGALDMTAEPALADAVDRVRGLQPQTVAVDLSGVTFVCSTFANFLADLHKAQPTAPILVKHPSRMAEAVLRITGLDALVTIDPHSRSSTPVPETRSIRRNARLLRQALASTLFSRN